MKKNNITQECPSIIETGDTCLTLAIPGPSYTVITPESQEALDIEIFYKGKRVINAHTLLLVGSGMLFDEVNWRKKFENQ